MKFALALFIVLGSASAAFADGWVCDSRAGDARIYVYDHAHRATRSGAVMVVSDPRVEYGRKTITRLTAENDTLRNVTDDEGVAYEGRVDFRFNDTGDRGEFILGTRLGNVDTIKLQINAQYPDLPAKGRRVAGIVTLELRNGTDAIVRDDFSCRRYTKGSDEE